ncbi:hypothetical protein ES708_19327 [subsurface metagenome]
MYIESITISNFRTFRKARIELSHSDRKPTKALPTPKLPNVNLLLGNNGLGKTTLLKAISLAALGPAVADSGIYPYRLIRREPDVNRPMGPIGESERRLSKRVATLKATFKTHPQDSVPVPIVQSRVKISQRGDLEQLRWAHKDEKVWHPIFSSSSRSNFLAAVTSPSRASSVNF